MRNDWQSNAEAMKQNQNGASVAKEMSRKEFLVAVGMMAGSAALAGVLGKGSLAKSLLPGGKGEVTYGNGAYGGRA